MYCRTAHTVCAITEALNATGVELLINSDQRSDVETRERFDSDVMPCGLPPGSSGRSSI